MKYLAALLALLCLVAWAPAKPKVRTMGLSLTAPDSSVVVTATAYLSGPLQAPDSIRWTVYRNDSLQVAPVVKEAVQTFTLGAPAYGATAVYKVCARVFRGTVASGNFQCASKSYTRPTPPLPPPPTVDSMTIDPRSLTLRPGQSVSLMATIYPR